MNTNRWSLVIPIQLEKLRLRIKDGSPGMTTSKAMDFKDYYEIFGVPPDAEKKVTQQTFRKLARKYHPDLNPGNKESEEKSR